MSNIKTRLNKILETICVLLFIFITIVGTYQIVTRYVFGRPSTVSEELLTFSFTWMSLLAAALVFGRRGHMRMEFAVGFLKEKSQIMLNVFSEVLVLIFSVVVLIYGGVKITNLTATQITASLGVPMSYVYVIIPVTGVLVVVYSILNINELMEEYKLGNFNREGQ